MTHQINIKVSEKDLKFIDAKARRYGLSRSAMIKYFSLNADFTVEMSEQLRRPVI
jgi:predicted DNA binding CopG/RHH family protein